MYRNSNYAVNYSGNLRINYQMNPYVNLDDPFINKTYMEKGLNDIFSKLFKLNYGIKFILDDSFINKPSEEPKTNINNFYSYISKDLIYYKNLETNEEIFLKRFNDLTYQASLNDNGELILDSIFIYEEKYVLFEELLPYKEYKKENFINEYFDFNFAPYVGYSYFEDGGNTFKSLPFLKAITPLCKFDDFYQRIYSLYIDQQDIKVNLLFNLAYNQAKVNNLDFMYYQLSNVNYYFTFDKGESLPLNIKNLFTSIV